MSASCTACQTEKDPVRTYLAVRLEASSGGTGTERSWGESRSGGSKGEDGNELVLWKKKRKLVYKSLNANAINGAARFEVYRSLGVRYANCLSTAKIQHNIIHRSQHMRCRARSSNVSGRSPTFSQLDATYHDSYFNYKRKCEIIIRLRGSAEFDRKRT